MWDKEKVQVILRNPNPDLRVSELVTQRHKYVWVWAPDLGKMKLCLMYSLQAIPQGCLSQDGCLWLPLLFIC